MSSWPILPLFNPTASLHPTHPCHPTPSCINASNPLCGRVTSATVRNRVKLNRHQENGGERSSTDNQATLHSGPPLGLCHLSKTWLCPQWLFMTPALEQTGVVNINRLAINYLPPFLRALMAWNSKDDNSQSGIQTHYWEYAVVLRGYCCCCVCIFIFLFFWKLGFLKSAALATKQMARQPPLMSGVSERCMCECALKALGVYECL